MIDHLRRIEEDGEPMSAVSVFSTVEEDVLYDLDCWESFDVNPEKARVSYSRSEGNIDEDQEVHCGRRDEGKNHGDDGGEIKVEGEEGTAEEASRWAHQQSRIEKEIRWKAAEAVLAWLRSIESRLAEKCAEVCDAAWYDLGETITYKGRPVAYSIPATVMEAATKRREDEEDRDQHRRH